MVEDKFGLETWDAILQAANDDGIFLSTESYSDERLDALVVAAQQLSGIPRETLIRTFGEYMFPHFIKDHPMFVTEGMNLKEFLLTVDRVIHVEVHKLHPDAKLPSFSYKDENDSELVMYYTSSRKLCHLAEGLIAGAATHFKTQYTLDHEVCMHDGHDSCELHLRIIT